MCVCVCGSSFAFANLENLVDNGDNDNDADAVAIDCSKWRWGSAYLIDDNDTNIYAGLQRWFRDGTKLPLPFSLAVRQQSQFFQE